MGCLVGHNTVVVFSWSVRIAALRAGVGAAFLMMAAQGSWRKLVAPGLGAQHPGICAVHFGAARR
eukprot:5934943-Lingulodinium_polyedra.AAC.1